MLGYAALIFIFILVIKLYSKLKKNKDDYLNYGISKKDHSFLSTSLWLYLIPLLILIFPINPLVYLLYPLPIVILFIVPGIVYGRKAGASLSTSGIDVGVRAGRTAENVMWLGVGTLIFVLGNWGFGIFTLYLDQHFSPF